MAPLDSREGYFASKEPGRGMFASHRRIGVFGILMWFIFVWIETRSGASVGFIVARF